MENKIFNPRLFDLIIWILIVIIFTYDTFFNKIEDKKVWLITIILIIISTIIKLTYIGKEYKEKKYEREKSN